MSEQIGQQKQAYRRGVVLGLTMAEVGILIIFVLLLLIGFNELRLLSDAKGSRGKVAITTAEAASLQSQAELVRAIKVILGVSADASPDEIQTLIRSLADSTDAGAKARVAEVRKALELVRAASKEISNG